MQRLITFFAVMGAIASTGMTLAIIYLIIIVAKAISKYFEIWPLF